MEINGTRVVKQRKGKFITVCSAYQNQPETKKKSSCFYYIQIVEYFMWWPRMKQITPQRLLSLTRTNSQLDNCGNILTRSVQAIDCNSDMQIAHSYSLAREILNLGWSTGKGTGELIKVKCKTKNDCECSLSSEGDTEWMQWILNGKVGGVVVNAEVEEESDCICGVHEFPRDLPNNHSAVD